MTDSLAQLSKGALSDLAAVFAAMPEDALDGLVDAITKARRIVVFGLGREGLQMRVALMMASTSPSSASSGIAANTPARSLSAPFDNSARLWVMSFAPCCRLLDGLENEVFAGPLSPPEAADGINASSQQTHRVASPRNSEILADFAGREGDGAEAMAFEDLDPP